MLRKKFKDLNDIMENNTYIEFYIKKWFNFKKIAMESMGLNMFRTVN